MDTEKIILELNILKEQIIEEMRVTQSKLDQILYELQKINSKNQSING